MEVWPYLLKLLSEIGLFYRAVPRATLVSVVLLNSNTEMPVRASQEVVASAVTCQKDLLNLYLP